MNFVSRSISILFLAVAGVIGLSAATLNNIESARTFAAVGNRGCTVSGASVATPSVITCSAAHRLADGDPIQITGVGGTTTVNTVGYAKVTGQSATTFAFYSDAALTTGITGTGTYTSGGLVSFAFPISGITSDWTLRYHVDSLTASKKVLVSVEESADGFVSDIRQLAVFNDVGQVGTNGATKDYTIRSYQLPSARFGTANACIRLKVVAIDSSTTLTDSFFVEY